MGKRPVLRLSESGDDRSHHSLAWPIVGGCVESETHRGLLGEELFFAEVHLLGGPDPVRRFLPDLIDLICNRKIDPGNVFDLELPLEQAAEGYRAMDERRAIKALLWP